MSVIVWIGDEVGLQTTPVPMEGLHWIAADQTFEHCYTKYGFVTPLHDHDLNYCAMIENRMPPVPDHLRDASSGISWMLIDHYGEVWQIDAFADTEKGLNIFGMSVFSMPAGRVKTLAMILSDSDRDLVAGFLMAKPDKEAVTEFVMEQKISFGRKLNWFSKKDIVEHLNKQFPLGGNTDAKSGK
jgi:hypothetical protein